MGYDLNSVFELEKKTEEFSLRNNDDFLEYDDKENPENFVIVDMYEMAFADPKSKKPILLTYNARTCLAICARDPETGLTGLIHFVNVYFFLYHQSIYTIKKSNLFDKFFNRFRKSDQKVKLEIHLYGLENQEYLENFLEFLNLFSDNFEFEIISCGFNFSNQFKTDEEILNFVAKYDSDHFKKCVFLQYKNSDEDQKKDFIEALLVKNFAIDSRDGKIFSYFNFELRIKIQNLQSKNKQIISNKIFNPEKNILNISKFYETIYDPKLIDNGLINIKFWDEILYEEIIETLKKALIKENVFIHEKLQKLNPEIYQKDLKIIGKFFNNDPKFIDFSNLAFILDKIRFYEKKNNLKIEAIEQIKKFSEKGLS